MKHRMLVMSVIGAGALALSSNARAQSVRDDGLARSGNGIEIVAGLMDFDLSGTGATTALSIRGAKALTPRLSLSGGGGLKVHLDDRLYVIGEMRLRGLSRDFSASTAEWLGRIGWQLP